MNNWWEDEKYKRVVLADERTETVTDTAAAGRYGSYWNRCTCDQCGKDFNSKRRVMGTKYCSPKCRQKAYRENKKLYL